MGKYGVSLCGRILYMSAAIGMSLATHSSLHAGGLASPVIPSEALTSEASTPIGHVEWEITETSSGKVLGKGARDVKMNEVQVLEGDYLEQRLPLSDHFYVKLNSGRSDGPFRGFGMATGRDDQQTFCWEWFNVEGNKAHKLQEKGELEFSSEKLGADYEVTKTVFLTDVEMRVLDWEDGSPDPKNPKWRVKIRQGSTIDWPTAAGGKVVNSTEAAQWYKAHPPKPGFWESLVKEAEKNAADTTTTRP